MITSLIKSNKDSQQEISNIKIPGWNKEDMIAILNMMYNGFENIRDRIQFWKDEAVNYKWDNLLNYWRKERALRNCTEREIVLDTIDKIKSTWKVSLEPWYWIFYTTFGVLWQDKLSNITKWIFANFVDLARYELSQSKIKWRDFNILVNELFIGMEKKRKLSTIVENILPKETFSDNTRKQLELFFEKAYIDIHSNK